MVIIDNLGSLATGEDTKAYRQVVDLLYWFRARLPQVTCILLANNGKNDRAGLRGHTVLMDALDFVVEARGDGTTRLGLADGELTGRTTSLEIEKCRDATAYAVGDTVTLAHRAIGGSVYLTRAEDRPQTATRLRVVNAHDGAAMRRTDQQLVARLRHADKPMSREEWLGHLPRGSHSRVAKRLIASGQVVAIDGRRGLYQAA